MYDIPWHTALCPYRIGCRDSSSKWFDAIAIIGLPIIPGHQVDVVIRSINGYSYLALSDRPNIGMHRHRGFLLILLDLVDISP